MKLCSSPVQCTRICRKELDSPWSWLVCFSATLSIALMFGVTLNFGVLFPVLMEYFQESRERTAWVGSIGIAFTFALGPLTSALVNRLGCRLTAIIGGSTCVAGLLLSSLAPSIYIIYITYSVSFGFGSSCLFVSSYVIISQYFDKYRSIATGILASGTGLGVFAVAPILQALLDSFDWRKTYRITAGIFSVVCALCLTYDPTITKKGESQNTQGQNEEGDNQDTEGQNEKLEYQDELEETTTETPSKCVDFSVFKEKVFVVLTLSITVAFLGHHTPRLHLVKFSEDLQVSADAASRLFIYIGITTFIGRLLSGFLCNMRCVNPIYVFMVGLILDGSSVAYLSQAKNYGQLVAFAFSYGLADGLVIGTYNITILYCVEPKKRASAFGLGATFYGTMIATGPPLAGFMTDRLHSYTPSFILAAVSEFTGAALLLILVCNQKKMQKHEPLKSGERVHNEQAAMVWETHV